MDSSINHNGIARSLESEKLRLLPACRTAVCTAMAGDKSTCAESADRSPFQQSGNKSTTDALCYVHALRCTALNYAYYTLFHCCVTESPKQVRLQSPPPVYTHALAPLPLNLRLKTRTMLSPAGLDQ